MQQYTTTGELRWIENDDNTLMKYKLRRPYDYFELDDLLWGNANNDIGIVIKDYSGNILFGETGILEIDFDRGYTRYLVNDQDLDMVLFSNTNKDIVIKFYNFEIEAMTQGETDSEWQNTMSM